MNRRTLRILRGQVAYQLRLLVRTPMAAFAALLIPVMVLLAVGLLYDGSRVISRGQISYIQFFTPAMVAFATISACFAAVVTTTVQAREQGVLKRLRTTPLPPALFMLGRVVCAGVIAFASGTAVFAVGGGVYGFHVIWSHLPAALAVWALAVVTFCALGLAFSSLVPRAEAALPLAFGVMIPLCFISDVFQPLDHAPQWLRQLASSFPLRPLADQLESLMDPRIHAATLDVRHIEVIVCWGIGGALFAALRFRWEPVTQRRSLWRRATRPNVPLSAERLRELLLARETRGRHP